MKRTFLIFVLFAPLSWSAHAHEHMNHTTTLEHNDHNHDHHHDQLVIEKNAEVDSERFIKFIENLTGSQIAIVNVEGMVCDFCARGIEKTFMQDINVKRIDVDLNQGKVLIAYTSEAEIDFSDIKQKILSNGQNATGMQIIKL